MKSKKSATSDGRGGAAATSSSSASKGKGGAKRGKHAHVCVAKVRGFPWWVGRLTEAASVKEALENGKTTVYFFGTRKMCFFSLCEVDSTHVFSFLYQVASFAKNICWNLRKGCATTIAKCWNDQGFLLQWKNWSVSFCCAWQRITVCWFNLINFFS